MAKKIEQTFATLSAAGKKATASFPDDMRRQLWPLCCGATIISGFKKTHHQSVDEIVAEIKENLKAVPDFQVFADEQMNPQLCFIVLNSSQSASTKITEALTKAGFMKFASAGLWSGTGTFWVYCGSGKDFKVESGFTSYSAAKASQKTKIVGAGHNSPGSTADINDVAAA